jgi:hypothetical protein
VYLNYTMGFHFDISTYAYNILWFYFPLLLPSYPRSLLISLPGNLFAGTHYLVELIMLFSRIHTMYSEYTHIPIALPFSLLPPAIFLSPTFIHLFWKCLYLPFITQRQLYWIQHSVNVWKSLPTHSWPVRFLLRTLL